VVVAWLAFVSVVGHSIGVGAVVLPFLSVIVGLFAMVTSIKYRFYMLRDAFMFSRCWFDEHPLAAFLLGVLTPASTVSPTRDEWWMAQDPSLRHLLTIDS